MSIYKDFNNYLIYPNGDILNTKTNKFKKSSINTHGYKYVILWKNNISHNLRIHRLLALLYIINPLNKEMVNHIDANKLNNNLQNLEWNTRSENQCNLNDKLTNKNTSGYRGVSRHKNNVWRGFLTKNKIRYEKYFKTQNEAIKYRQELEKIHFKVL
jgi:hypothetical protein